MVNISKMHVKKGESHFSSQIVSELKVEHEELPGRGIMVKYQLDMKHTRTI